MPNETETVTITQTAPDGTETKIEITQTPPEGTDESLIEEVIEAIFDDTNGDGEITAEDLDTASNSTEYSVSEAEPTDTEFVITESEPTEVVYETQEANAVEDTTAPVATDETATESVEPEVFLPVNYDTAPTDFNPGAYDVSFVPAVENTSTETLETNSADSTVNESEAAESAEQQANADAARDAQQAAEDFVAAGDYEAAAEAREAAENAAWEAGDDSMLSGSNASELENAAWEQDQTDYYRQQQEEYTAQGDYEAAQEAANKVIENTSDADWYAGGNDHTTQARNEEFALENAVWEESNAENNAQNAEYFAEQGNYEAAADYAEAAVEDQVQADAYADSTMDGSTYDASSQVESGGSYDAADFSAVDYSSATDYSSYDAGTDYSTVDTSTTDYTTE